MPSTAEGHICVFVTREYVFSELDMHIFVPSTAETAALVGAAELGLLPSRAVLVNVAQPVECALLLAPPPHYLDLLGPALQAPGCAAHLASDAAPPRVRSKAAVRP